MHQKKTQIQSGQLLKERDSLLTISQMALFLVPISVAIPFMLPTLMTVLVILIIFSQKMQPYIKQLYHGVLTFRGTSILHVEKSQSSYFSYSQRSSITNLLLLPLVSPPQNTYILFVKIEPPSIYQEAGQAHVTEPILSVLVRSLTQPLY